MSIAARIKKYFRVVDQDVSDAAYNAVVLNFQKVELSARRLAFLLSQAPLMNIPEDTLSGGRAAGTKYAYAHPNTIRRLPNPSTRRTQWVESFSLPEGTVIFSNNAMPGLEKSNA